MRLNTAYLIAFFLLSNAICKAQPAAKTNVAANPNSTLLYQTPFEFQGSRFGDRWEPNAALLIPITINTSSSVVYLQFDTGSPTTLLYADKIRKIKEGPFRSQLAGDTLVHTFDFRIGARNVSLSNVKVIQQNDDVSTDSTKKLIIGTLGMDIIDQHVLVLDFLKHTFTLTESIPDFLQSRMSLTDFYYSQRHILLPVLIQGQSKIVYFDSGSSAFSLITDKNNWQKLANPDSASTPYSVSSWSNTLKAITTASNARIRVADRDLPIHQVTYIDGASQNQIQQMQAMGIGGLVGNKLFLNSVLIIDTKHKKFGVCKSL